MSAAEPKTNFDFMGKRYLTLFFSFCILSFSIYQWIAAGSSKYGVDFLGGNELVIGFDGDVEISQIREALESKGIDSFNVQSFEKSSNEFSIRLKGSENAEASKPVLEALSSINVPYHVLRNDYVGPVIGDKIKNDGYKAIFFSAIIMLVYITWKFEFSFALGAIVALVHDVFMSASLFIFLGGEIGATALAALLTVLGYSINDTIIIYDRIRENMLLKIRSKNEAKIGTIDLRNMNLSQIINLSINQTLSRTLLTSGTTLFTCFSLWYFGGGAMADLALILTIGIITGTYSTFYVATIVVLYMEKFRSKS